MKYQLGGGGRLGTGWGAPVPAGGDSDNVWGPGTSWKLQYCREGLWYWLGAPVLAGGQLGTGTS